MFKTPQFWQNKNLVSFALLPFSLIYKFLFFIKKKSTKSLITKIPTICIGNITAGGSGKTPFALKLGKILLENDINFCYLTRGYKAKNSANIFLPKNSDISVDKIGDEAMLLNEIASVMIAKNRRIGYQEIEKKSSFNAIIMDDGLQNFQLQTQIKILLIDSKIGFGNNFLLPSGPLRQSLASIAKNIDFFVIIGEKNPNIVFQIQQFTKNPSIICGKIVPKNLSEFVNKELIAFCGIAYPQKFFYELKRHQLNVVKEFSFADHHNYKISEIDNLINLAIKNNCQLITTKKDWVKFSPPQQKLIKFFDIELEFDNIDCIINSIKKITKNVY